MTSNNLPLKNVFSGWDGYNQSIIKAVKTLTSDQLALRSADGQQTIGEIARHISLGRMDWLRRMNAPGHQTLIDQIPEWHTDKDGNNHVVPDSVDIATNAEALAQWLQETWQVIESNLEQWTTADLMESYRYAFMGKEYAVSRQWTLWRMMSHDIHHGGRLALTLEMCKIEAFELIALFGHIIEPPLWEG